MQNGVLFLTSLITNIIRDGRLVTKLADRVHKISIRPKFSSPKLFLHFWMLCKNLSGCETFQNRDDLSYTHLRNRLNQKMNMVLVCANLQKMNLISLLNFKTSLFQRLINFLAKNNSPIFCRTHKVIQQYTDIMRFMYVLAFAHTCKDINYAASGGELTPKRD